MNKLKSISNKTLQILTRIPRMLLPSPTREQLVLLGIYSLVQFIYMAVVFYKHEFNVGDPTVLAFFTEKYVFDLAAYMTGVLLLLKIFKSYLWAYAFSILYFLIFIVDSAIYFFASTLLENHHFALITPYSIAGFITWRLLLMLGIFFAILWLVRLPLKQLQPKAKWRSSLKWALIAITVICANGAIQFADRKKADDRLDKVIMVFRNAQLEYATQNPAGAFINDVILKNIAENLYSVTGSATYQKYMKSYNLIQKNYTITGDIAPYKKIISKYNLPIGKRSYEDLGLKPFNKIILLFVESLSSDLIKCYNDQLKTPIGDYFLCTKQIKDVTFTNFRVSGSPTLQGMTTVFSSHPNYNIQKQTGDQLAFLKPLKKQGFKTLFIRSASKFFANENIIFKKWGFDKIEAREDFFKREDLKKYIYGWGLEDRKLYDELIEHLKQHKNDKLFVSLIGTDTHPLNGQRYFKHLTYPPMPPAWDKTWGRAKHFMKAVRNTDFDLNRLVNKMKKEGVFTDDTLLIITGDHSCPPNTITRIIPGHTRKSLGLVPIVFVTSQKLPKFRRDILSSQLDIAPTIFHMLGLDIPKGWWGQSLFYSAKKNPYVGFHKKIIHIYDKDGNKKYINLKKLKTPEEKAFNKLFSTIITK